MVLQGNITVMCWVTDGGQSSPVYAMEGKCLFHVSKALSLTDRDYSLFGNEAAPVIVGAKKISSICVERFIINSWISHDVTAAMLVSPNNEMAAMLVFRSNPPGIESYYYANVFFCFR